MRVVAELPEYLAASDDAVLVSRRFSAYHAGGVFGFMAWGAPDLRDARLAVEAREAELAHGAPHVLLVDYRLLESVDPDVFRCIADWVALRAVPLAERTTRAALIPPQEPFAAAIVGGFYSVFKSPYPSKLCPTLADADKWLGVPASKLAEEIEGVALGRELSTELGRLLEKQPRLSIEEAAAALALTPRTLQRRLAKEQTTYRDEVRRAMLKIAKRLLATTDMKVSAIALAAGCGTAQHFNRFFQAGKESFILLGQPVSVIVIQESLLVNLH